MGSRHHRDTHSAICVQYFRGRLLYWIDVHCIQRIGQTFLVRVHPTEHARFHLLSALQGGEVGSDALDALLVARKLHNVNVGVTILPSMDAASFAAV